MPSGGNGVGARRRCPSAQASAHRMARVGEEGEVGEEAAPEAGAAPEEGAALGRRRSGRARFQFHDRSPVTNPANHQLLPQLSLFGNDNFRNFPFLEGN